MRGLVPRIHVFLATQQRRGWPGHIGERSDAVLLTAMGERSDAVLLTAMGERRDAVLLTAMGERSDAVLLTAMGERSDAVLLTAMPGHDGAESQIPNTSLKNRAVDP